MQFDAKENKSCLDHMKLPTASQTQRHLLNINRNTAVGGDLALEFVCVFLYLFLEAENNKNFKVWTKFDMVRLPGKTCLSNLLMTSNT